MGADMMRARVLVVDDHPIVLDGIRALAAQVPDVEIAGYARTGREAIAQAIALEPDVILLDMRLPDMLGSEVARAVKTKVPKARILLFTAFPNHAGVAAAMAAGIDGVLVKDVSRTDLVEAIRQSVQDGRRPVEENAHLRQDRPAKQRSMLTRREYDVLRRLATGETNAEIACVLKLSPNTVKTYLQVALQKLGARNRVEAISRAAELGLL
jgi:DNA-binding NarL/FixJ family response regulator